MIWMTMQGKERDKNVNFETDISIYMSFVYVFFLIYIS